MAGHIRPHGPGAWRIYAAAGTDAVTGRRRQVTRVVHGPRQDAERALARLVTEVADGHHHGTTARTFGDLLDAWLDHKTLSVEPTTAATYRHSASYVPARLRALPAARVDVATLEALYAHLRRAGHRRTGGPLSAAAVGNVHAAIRSAFELGRRRKWVAANPAADAEVPTAPRRLPSPLAVDAVPALLAAAAAEHHALPTYLQVSICAGGRRGEIHGIRWSGIDWHRGAVVLRDTIRPDGTVKPSTKTGGQRTILVGAATLARLEALHDRAVTDAMTCETALPPGGFVFSDSPVGETPWNPNTTMRRFKRACAAAGLPPGTRLHDLRHLMATFLIDEGIPIPVVSARLGHAQNSTTLDIYTGRVAASDAAAAAMMDRLFSPEKGER